MKKKLSKKVKAKWIRALLSGKYQQGQGYLKNTCNEYASPYYGKTEFCCLGVARECGLGVKHPRQEVLTEEFLSHKVQSELATFNDDGKSFAWIANYIKKHL